MHFPRLSALQNQRDGRTFLGADQILGDRGDRQKAGNRDMILIDVTVREDQYIGTLAIGTVHLQKQPVNGFFQTRIFIIIDRDHTGMKTRFVQMPNL